MRSVVIILCVVGVVTSGCKTAVLREVRYPGGYPGYILDKRTIDASENKPVQILRAAMIVAMISRMATSTIRDGKDADGFADYLAAASDEINYAASHIYGGTDVIDCAIDGDEYDNCNASPINLEADIPLIEARITRLVLAALPENRVRKFLQDAAKGNVLGAAWNAVRAVAQSTDGLRRSAAVFRSNLELAAMINRCPVEDEKEGALKERQKEEPLEERQKEDPQKPPEYNPKKDTVLAAAKCFNLDDKTLMSDHMIKIDKDINKNTYHSVFLIARTSCVRLPLNTDELVDSIERRKKLCERIRFVPRHRPEVVQGLVKQNGPNGTSPNDEVAVALSVDSS